MGCKKNGAVPNKAGKQNGGSQIDGDLRSMRISQEDKDLIIQYVANLVEHGINWTEIRTWMTPADKYRAERLVKMGVITKGHMEDSGRITYYFDDTDLWEDSPYSETFKKLYLEWNLILKVTPESFEGLSKLETLYLNNNHNSQGRKNGYVPNVAPG